MTVTTTTSSATYTGDGSTVLFDVPFQFFDNTELKVFKEVIATGVETLQTQGSDYMLTGGNGATGRVDFSIDSAPPASTERVIVRRETVVTQNLDITNAQRIPSGGLERALDRSVMRDQEATVTVSANNTSLETALQLEHYYEAGSAFAGRHKIGVGTASERTSTPNMDKEGAIWILTGGDIPAGQGELSFYDSSVSAWRLAGGRMLRNFNNTWAVSQHGTWVEVAVVGGNLTPDLSTSNFFYSTLSSNATLVNPTNKPASGSGGTWTYQIAQDASGGNSLTLGTDYLTVSNIGISLTQAANAVDMLYMTLRRDGKIHIDHAVDIR